MQYSTVLMFSVLTAGALGGAASFVGSGADVESVSTAISDAKDSFRDTMRELDKDYYRRGETYEVCATRYGGRMAGQMTNGDITLSCECFDKTMAAVGGLDRDTALKALGPGPEFANASAQGVKLKLTVAAGRVLRRCNIEPWLDGELPQSAKPIENTIAKPMSGGLRGSF